MTSSRKFVILSVDDDAGDRELLQFVCESLGTRMSLHFAIDGEQAIDYLSGAGKYRDRALYPVPDVLLLDLKLPRRSGFEVLEWARGQERYKTTPIFVMTSSAERKDIDRCYALGGTAFLVKSPGLDELERTVHGLAAYAERLVSRRP